MARKSSKPIVVEKQSIVEQTWTAERLAEYVESVRQHVIDELAPSTEYDKITSQMRLALDKNPWEVEHFLLWNTLDVLSATNTYREFQGFWNKVEKRLESESIESIIWLGVVRAMIVTRVAEIREELPNHVRYGLGRQSTSIVHTAAEQIKLRDEAELMSKYERVAMRIEFALETINEKQAKIVTQDVDLQAEHDFEPGYKAN